MSTINLQEVHAVYLSKPGRWPDGNSTNYDDILATRHIRSFQHDEDTIIITSRIYPLYSEYTRANHKKLPDGCNTPGDINNTVLPHPAVMEEQLRALQELAKECQIIRWAHSTQCFRPVAQALRSLFKLSILEFGDDCPGSTERKTFPIVDCFDVLLHRMLVWSYQTGQYVPDKYQEVTPSLQFYHTVGGPHSGIAQYARVPEERIRYHLIWLGCMAWMNPERSAFFQELTKLASNYSYPIGLFGKDMRDGVLGSGTFDAEPIAKLYSESLLGLNYPTSSFFNTRLFDLPAAGIAPMMHDTYGELAAVGILPGEHYIDFDNTALGALDTAADWVNKAKEARLLANNAQKHNEYLLRTSSDAAQLERIVTDNLHRFK